MSRFLQLLHCDFRAGHECSGVQLGLPQKLQCRFESFFLSVLNSFRFRAGQSNLFSVRGAARGDSSLFFVLLFYVPVFTVVVI